MKFPKLQLLGLLLREATSPAVLQRSPEPSSVMDSTESVTSFDQQGSALTPIYHFNALACSKRLHNNATLLDLGSGSGQFLSYLARCRPDIKIIGLDLSETMVELGRRNIKSAGLETSIDLRVGDMTCFSSDISEKIDLITSVFAFHHLPSAVDLKHCMDEIAHIRRRDDSGIWIFDHSRPNHPHTAEMFPEIFTPDASAHFKADSRNSLIASFSFQELSKHLAKEIDGRFRHRQSHLMRLYQAHWLEPETTKPLFENECSNNLPLARYQRQFKQLQSLFKGIP